MSKHSDAAPGTIVAIERLLLTALCQESLPDRNRDEVLRRLGSHPFRDPAHEVLFRALAKVSAGREGLRPEVRAALRAEIAMCLTRLGFPDFDLDPFFNTAPPSLPPTMPEVAVLLQRL